jgi:hypothetical protein
MEAGEMRGPSPWNDERDQQLTADWAAGFTTSKIGERMGISKNSVIGRARRLQLPRRASPINVTLAQPWTDEDDVYLRRVYGGFLTAAEIGARMGRSTHAIAYRAATLGLVAGRRAKQTRPRQTSARPSAGRDAFSFPGQSRPVTISGVSSAVERLGASPQVENLPGAVAETPPPRVFSGTQCRYFVGDRTCDEPVRANARGLKSSYCPEHFAVIYAAPPAKSANNPPPAGWLKNRLAMRAHG